jgi:hypothetical protein
MKELITWYGDSQIHILWTVIAVFSVIILFLTLRRNKKVVGVPFNFKYRLLEKLDMLVYGLSVGPVVDSDVVKRVLTLEVNDQLVETREFGPDATDLGEVGVAEGSYVNLALVDVDDAGNVSEPAFLRFVSADTLPPVAPGGFGAVLVREVANEIPVVESDATPVVEVETTDPVDMVEPVIEVVDTVVPQPPEEAETLDDDTTA